MNNFGVIELASTKTTHAPGWAYVPDTGPSQAAAALAPTNRKRAARNNQNTLSYSDVSARQDVKIRKELEQLDKDTHKDVNIPIPAKAGRVQQKHTPNVRKILQSQKTFANHLDDYQALLALAETNPAAAAAAALAAGVNNPVSKGGGGGTTAANSASGTPAPQQPPGGADKGGVGGSKRSAAAAKRAAAAEAKNKKKQPAQVEKGRRDEQEDVEMTDAPQTEEPTTETTGEVTGAEKEREGEGEGEREGVQPQQPQSYPRDGTILSAYQRPPPPSHPADNDPLLVSRVPPFPTDDELRALMTAPPLSYLDARAAWGDEERKYPARTFCDVCGYWGRVRCIKCGARVCALDCLDVHREECITRYGL
ncbi:hypothetical protein QBC46DRAFT_353226 [Diplogelasinospora grovesii]|uniref:HIT-type domain-containing protein n=1 Tax=Diplogelasinospora grovesii TaxID=303347 RepID=A0AAN6S694_9PEZI|nr:hypothetical protein QBC46DRAFT_353226 [Diplogelasinospora grovesii]